MEQATASLTPNAETTAIITAAANTEATGRKVIGISTLLDVSPRIAEPPGRFNLDSTPPVPVGDTGVSGGIVRGVRVGDGPFPHRVQGPHGLPPDKPGGYRYWGSTGAKAPFRQLANPP